jgi:surface antigen
VHKSKISFFSLILLVISCENSSDKKVFGQIIGAAVGGYVGSKIGSGATKDISVILGGAAGYILGGKIIEILSEKDRKEFNNVIENSLNFKPDNSSEFWQSDENQDVSGEVIPLNNYQKNNKNCRDFKKVIRKNNDIFEENSTACRNKDGNWEII